MHFAPDSSGPTGVDYLNPRPEGGIVVGGGKWVYNADRASWYDNCDDSYRFSPPVERYWNGYMQSNFLGWQDSNVQTDKVWVGSMGITPNGMPHVGRVLETSEKGEEQNDKGKQWILAGFNGGGMALIATSAKAVAKMVLEDKGFNEVKEEFGLLEGFATSVERLQAGGVVQEMTGRK